MAKHYRKRNAQAVSDLVSRLVDPVLRKKTGVSLELIEGWEEIAGRRLARLSRPEKIVWPRRSSEDDPFKPATLVIAAEGYAALAIQHETGELISRVNTFLGYGAIERIKLVQRPVTVPERRKARPTLRSLRCDEEEELTESLAEIESDKLRQALERLGRAVKSESKP
ncbi:DUF721 domain-containing protein [Notoacmeibacter sp. MSK16QG-6]|uniref:DUF721 domain-containing protein n=1 Tax=Notoacmeibacter sp. MSK16QG-6 TaxID=2957982 RepID=UPI0020A20512|nr:DciA family protein [Notoacmeibacter sp. MSK16QG-6]MCP1198204.1 DciA family protein [Notoacmeibacter sp. MSK16QG-6]